jgi:hypothetical protein
VANHVTIQTGMNLLKQVCFNASIINPKVKEALTKLIVKPNIKELLPSLEDVQTDLFIKHKSEILDSLKIL